MIDTDLLIAQLEGWWQDDVFSKHKENVKKLGRPSSFNINPFLHPYIANFVYGDTSPISLAKALVLPRAMGTSVTTTFGKKMQDFIVANIEHAEASGIDGIDIEFKNQATAEAKKMYCQVKAGPNTINSDDVAPIGAKFTKLRNKARLDKLSLESSSLIVGVLYGCRADLSNNYLNIENKHGYGVFVGAAFWGMLTGDSDFYDKMSNKLGDLSQRFDETEYIQTTIDKLSQSKEIIALSKQGVSGEKA